MAHKLYIHVKDSLLDNNHMVVTDLSVWDEQLQVRDRTLQILPPFGDKYVKIVFPQNQVTAINSVNLLLDKKGSSLPDGPYLIHYSVSPNDTVRLDFCHYRVGTFMNEVLGKMAKIAYTEPASVDRCGNVELSKMETTLLHIFSMLKGVQAIGQESHMQFKADEMYRAARRRFDLLFDEQNCSSC